MKITLKKIKRSSWDQPIVIKNYTPHPINICNNQGEIVKTFKSEGLIRLKSETVKDGEINDISISKTVFGQPEGLPSFQEGIYYIVSQLVKNALPDRKDLLVPAEVLRDDSGKIIGCQSLGK